ncbi:MAG: hypothetical protein GKR94_04850 [Gammaproteobacteria bacterium]|nr:hypothetical protein [Gammaproteobacteria bacterium]
MLKKSTERAVERFREDGFLSPVPVLSAAEVKHYTIALEDFERRSGKPLDFP